MNALKARCGCENEKKNYAFYLLKEKYVYRMNNSYNRRYYVMANGKEM